MLLGLYGYEARVAVDGAGALAACADWRPDAVLLDLRLPDMSGYRVAEEVRRLRPFHRPLLIAVTACGRPEDREASAAAGIDLHLLKPLDPNVLRTLLDRLQKVIH